MFDKYTYDANGDTLSVPSGKGFTWNFENRLTAGWPPLSCFSFPLRSRGCPALA